MSGFHARLTVYDDDGFVVGYARYPIKFSDVHFQEQAKPPDDHEPWCGTDHGDAPRRKDYR